MKKNFSTFVLLLVVFRPSAQIKIICTDVDLAKKPLSEVTYVKAIETRIGGKFEACEFKRRNEPIVPTDIHPFVASLYIAYADHRPISISPDMIWLLICQGFSTHVNNNIEELRKEFVRFDGKKKLIVQTQSISQEFQKGSTKSPWPLAFPVMSDSISKYVKSDIHNLYVQSFSTTTYVEKASYEVALLDVMSGYFEYECSTMCGIPAINIEGTKTDWLKIKKELQHFKGYKIDNWINSLEPIIQQFINASDNKIDTVCWSNIFKRKDESGGPYITGWIIKFFPYINDNNKVTINPYIDKEPKKHFEGLLTNQFNNGLSKADFIWNYYGTKYEMEFLAGFIGIKQDKKTLTLRPEIGWLVKDKNNAKIAPIKDEKTLDNTNSFNWKKYLFISLAGLLIVFILFGVIKHKNKKR
jgi:hypothetical protein